MLNDYIEAYKSAFEVGDKREMERIERDLATLGMDRYTLRVLVAEKMKEICNDRTDND